MWCALECFFCGVYDVVLLSGTAPSAIRRDVCAIVERQKQSTREPHPLFGQILATKCLKSRHGFLPSVKPANVLAQVLLLFTLSLGSSQSRLPASRLLSSRMKSIDLLHRSDGINVV